VRVIVEHGKAEIAVGTQSHQVDAAKRPYVCHEREGNAKRQPFSTKEYRGVSDSALPVGCAEEARSGKENDDGDDARERRQQWRTEARV